ncbi:MAG: hypothetical protein V1843_02800, partial [bacterium]
MSNDVSPVRSNFTVYFGNDQNVKVTEHDPPFCDNNGCGDYGYTKTESSQPIDPDVTRTEALINFWRIYNIGLPPVTNNNTQITSSSYSVMDVNNLTGQGVGTGSQESSFTTLSPTRQTTAEGYTDTTTNNNTVIPTSTAIIYATNTNGATTTERTNTVTVAPGAQSTYGEVNIINNTDGLIQITITEDGISLATITMDEIKTTVDLGGGLTQVAFNQTMDYGLDGAFNKTINVVTDNSYPDLDRTVTGTYSENMNDVTNNISINYAYSGRDPLDPDADNQKMEITTINQQAPLDGNGHAGSFTGSTVISEGHGRLEISIGQGGYITGYTAEIKRTMISNTVNGEDIVNITENSVTTTGKDGLQSIITVKDTAIPGGITQAMRTEDIQAYTSENTVTEDRQENIYEVAGTEFEVTTTTNNAENGDGLYTVQTFRVYDPNTSGTLEIRDNYPYAYTTQVNGQAVRIHGLNGAESLDIDNHTLTVKTPAPWGEGQRDTTYSIYNSENNMLTNSLDISHLDYQRFEEIDITYEETINASGSSQSQITVKTADEMGVETRTFDTNIDTPSSSITLQGDRLYTYQTHETQDTFDDGSHISQISTSLTHKTIIAGSGSSESYRSDISADSNGDQHVSLTSEIFDYDTAAGTSDSFGTRQEDSNGLYYDRRLQSGNETISGTGADIFSEITDGETFNQNGDRIGTSHTGFTFDDFSSDIISSSNYTNDNGNVVEDVTSDTTTDLMNGDYINTASIERSEVDADGSQVYLKEDTSLGSDNVIGSQISGYHDINIAGNHTSTISNSAHYLGSNASYSDKTIYSKTGVDFNASTISDIELGSGELDLLNNYNEATSNGTTIKDYSSDLNLFNFTSGKIDSTSWYSTSGDQQVNSTTHFLTNDIVSAGYSQYSDSTGANTTSLDIAFG